MSRPCGYCFMLFYTKTSLPLKCEYTLLFISFSCMALEAASSDNSQDHLGAGAAQIPGACRLCWWFWGRPTQDENAGKIPFMAHQQSFCERHQILSIASRWTLGLCFMCDDVHFNTFVVVRVIKGRSEKLDISFFQPTHAPLGLRSQSMYSGFSGISGGSTNTYETNVWQLAHMLMVRVLPHGVVHSHPHWEFRKNHFGV